MGVTWHCDDPKCSCPKPSRSDGRDDRREQRRENWNAVKKAWGKR